MKSKFLFFFIIIIIKVNVYAQNPQLIGYWHNWQAVTVPYFPLDQVDSRYNIVCVAFGTPQVGTNANITFTPTQATQATFITQIQTLRNQGKKVILSIGGASGAVLINNATDRTAFINSVTNILNTYPFDGIDIDFEKNSLSVSGGTIANPVNQPIVNLIAGIKQIMANYRASKSRKLFLSLTPETAFVQGGMSAYSGTSGAYLPVIHALRDSLDFLQVQLYNSAMMKGINGSFYTQATPDFILSQTEAVIKGFNTNGGAFVGLPAHKVVVALPACSSAAASGYILPETVSAAVNYLRGAGPKPSNYTLAQTGGYPNLGGMMTWSINWDKLSTCGGAYQFAENFDRIFKSGTTTNTTPSVSITSPTNNASFNAPTSVTVNATATDADGTITKVAFYNGAVLLSTDFAAPYSFVWANVPVGSYSLTAKAYDNAGAVTTSVAVPIVVKTVTNTPPSVSITSPTNNASFNAPTSVTINATATDANGTITKVAFYNGTVLLSTDFAAPYSFLWANVPVGSYSLTAKAYDNAGAVTTSVAVPIVVKTVTNTPPSVSITSPTNNASFNAPASVTINATATDANGTITKVAFYNGTVLLSTDFAAPYSFVWANVPAGSYSLTAKAYDNAGAVTTSSIINITGLTTTDLIGANCASLNNVLVYELSAANIPNITTTSWWSSGSVSSIVPVVGQPWKATVSFGTTFKGGNVCVGVNYSASPWYKQICKSVSLCPAIRSGAPESKSGIVSPIPTSSAFNFNVPKGVETAKVFDQLGIEKANLRDIQEYQSLVFGEELPAGIYFLTLLYEDKSTEVIKLFKVK